MGSANGAGGAGSCGSGGVVAGTVVVVVVVVVVDVLVVVVVGAAAAAAPTESALKPTSAIHTVTGTRRAANIPFQVGILAPELQAWPNSAPNDPCFARGEQGRQFLGTWLHGRSLSARGSPGNPRTRSPKMFFMMLVVPPSIEFAWTRKNAFWGLERSIAVLGRSIG